MAERKLDDYKPISFYKKYTKAKQSGFSRFDVDGDYYFCRHVDGDIALISQSYTGEAGRDNGIESVKKNSKLRNRYVFEDRAGRKHGFSLIAGNRQEIAVSPDYTSKKKAEFTVGRMRGTEKAPVAKTTKATAGAASLTAAAVVATPKFTNVEDDYRPLDFYERQTKGRDHGIETFKGDDGEHYFAYFENGKIALISEGYPTIAARDTGVASVEKNIGLENRYQHRGPLKNEKYDFKLKAGNNKEIARSVWYSSAAAAATGAAYLIGTRKRSVAVPPVAAPIAAAALASTVTGTASAAPVKEESAVPSSYDDSEGGLWKWLRWLLLALLALLALFFLFKACSGPDKTSLVRTPAPEVTVVSCWNGSEADYKEACPAKITCWDGSFTTSEASCPVEVTTVTCWDGSSAETFSACPVEPAPEPEIVQPLRNTTTVATLGAASIFAAGNAEAVLVKRLGTNPEFGDSHSLTPSSFYDKLSTQYATNEYDRKYLDFLFRQLGYSGGFKDVTAAAFSNAVVANGSRGVLGYSAAHAYQYSEFDMRDARDLEAFRIQSLNGKDIYFMKTCGNYFYITG